MTADVLETTSTEPAHDHAPTGPAEPSPRRWAALYVLCVGMLMIVVDGTVVNVALPSIQSDLGFSSSGLAWVVNAYLIAFGGLLLLSGRLGDLLGRRRTFLVGLVIFTAASLACALSFSAPVLIAARLVQGAGGALTSAGILGMIVTMFPDPAERTKALGVYGFVASSGGSIGLLGGGVLTQSVGWHSIFVINLPIGIATGVLALRYVPDHRGPGLSEGLDAIGGVLLTAGVMVGVLAILGASDGGWIHALEGVASVALIASFVLRQARIAVPLIPLRLFRSRNVSGVNIIQALMVVGMFGMFFLAALYLQQVKGFSSLEVGLAFLPTTVVMAAVSLKGAQPLAARFGERRVVVVGTLLIAVGLLVLAQTPATGSPLATVLPATVLLGFGVGMSMPSLMSLGMSGVEPADAGAASGLLNTSLQVGGALGLAVLASLSSARTRSLLDSGHTHAVAQTSGYHLAYLVGAVGLVAASLIARFVLRPGEHGGVEGAHAGL